MAIKPVLDCKFPQNLESSAAALEQEIGDRFAQNLALLEIAEASTAGIPEALAEALSILDQIMANGDSSSNLGSSADVAEQFGLQQTPSTELGDERFLFYGGVILLDGVVYLPNGSNNIENLRRLYFASGRSLTKTAEYLQSNRTLIFHGRTAMQVVAAKDPNRTAFTLDEIKTQLNANYLTERDIVVNTDSTTSVLMRDGFLAVDQSLAETKKQYGISDSEIATSVFHFNIVDNTTTALARYSNYGYAGEFLTAILNGDDLSVVSQETIDNKLNTNKAAATSIIGKIDFILSRIANLPDISGARDKIRAAIQALIKDHLSLIGDIRFQVSVIGETDTLAKLRANHTDAVIRRLLEQRTEVTGIKFGASDKEISKMLSGAYAMTPGSTLISNRFLSRGLSEEYNTKTLVKMYSDLYAADLSLSRGVTISNFTISKQSLIDFGGHSPKLDPATSYVNPDGSLGNPKLPGQIYQGQPSAGTPASVLAERMDVGRSFSISLRIKALDDLLEGIDQFFNETLGRPIAAVLKLLTELFKKAMAAIDLLGERAKGLLMPIKKALDSFMSKFLSLTGSGSFDSSLLKCAINFDFGISIDLIDQLLAFMDSITALLGNFISSLINWIADLIKNVICLPINLISAFIGGLGAALPSFCQAPSFDIGDPIKSALEELLAVANFKQANMMAFGTDLVRYRATVTGAPDKLSQFKSGGLCNSGAAGGFMAAAALNIGGGAVASPFGG